MSFTDILNDSKPVNYHEQGLECSWDEFSKVIASRRSIRLYGDTPVPEVVINNAIDAALIAPTSSNLQQTEFYWVRAPEKKDLLAKACLNQPAAKTARELVVIVARTNTWQRNCREVIKQLKASGAPKSALTYYEKLVPLAYRNGPFGIFGLIKRVVFAVKGFTGPTPREPKSFSDMRVWAHKSASVPRGSTPVLWKALILVASKNFWGSVAVLRCLWSFQLVKELLEAFTVLVRVFLGSGLCFRSNLILASIKWESYCECKDYSRHGI